MPNRDKTGPMGMGPITGRGMGPCGGGMGWGRICGWWGYGRGWGIGRSRFYAMTGEEKKEILKKEAQYLKENLDEIEKEIKAMEE